MIRTATQVRRLREKYGKGICGEAFIQTGVPQINKERLAAASKEVAKLEKEINKMIKKSEREALKIYKKNHKGAMPPADQIIFY